jgi:endoglucanase
VKNEENPSEVEASKSGATSFTRRTLLKSSAALAAASALPGPLLNALPQSNSTTQSNMPTIAPTKNPRWYGFNLLEYFSTDPDWMKYFPYKDDGLFQEDDFRWIRDWGFTWVRLPMDYRFWTAPDLFTIDEKNVEPIDRAIRLGQKYNVHVNICLHRAPGLCILDTMNEQLTGIRITKEKTDVFTDPHTFDAFVHQWSYFADRYKGIPSYHLSFNLVNEPLALPTAEELAALQKEVKTSNLLSSDLLMRHLKDYVRLAKASNDAVHQRDAQRLVVTDGYPGAGSPISGLASTGMLQSCHTYSPMLLTHHGCEWAMGMLTGKEPVPTWPLKDEQGKVISDREILEKQFQPWGALAGQGVPIHFGEMGCYKHTSPDVVLAWFNDMLDIIGDLHSGWALWNFRGPFGVLDTERPGTKFEDWHGHKLDRPLLSLLQKKMKA